MEERTKEQEAAWKDSFIEYTALKPKPILYKANFNNTEDTQRAHTIADAWGYVGYMDVCSIGLRNDKQLQALKESGLEFKIEKDED